MHAPLQQRVTREGVRAPQTSAPRGSSGPPGGTSLQCAQAEVGHTQREVGFPSGRVP